MDLASSVATASGVPAPEAGPIATDSGNNAEIVTVTGKSMKLDRSGFVNGSKASGQTFRLETAQTQIRITQREILEATLPVGTITNTLANQPNVITPVTTSPIVGGNIFLRGFSKSLLNLTLDGLPMNLVSDYSVYVNQLIPLGLIGDVDVKPGSGSAATIGYSNFGGTIDVQSALPADHSMATLEGGLGSFGEQKYGVTVHSGEILHGTTTLVATFNQQRADGYFSKGADGTPVASGAVPVSYQAGAKLVSHIGPGTLTGLASFNNQKFYVIDGATPALIGRYGPKATVLTGPFNIATDWQNNLKKSRSSIDYLDYVLPLGGTVRMSERSYYGDSYSYVSSVPTANPYSSRYEQESLRQFFRYGSITRLTASASSWADLESGFWIDYTRFTSSIPYGPLFPHLVARPDSAYVVDKTTTLQPYLQATVRLGDRIIFVPGLKYTDTSRIYRDKVARNGYDKNWSDLLPSVGVNLIAIGTRSRPMLTFYGNYTRSLEPPAFGQISSAAQNFELAPQYADSFEAGPMWSVGRWSGKLSLFETHFLNYIRSINISNAAHPSGVTAYTNAGGAVYQGVDLNNSVKLTSTLSAFANIGLLDAHFSSVSTPITYAPRNTDAVGLRYQGNRLQLGVSVQYNPGYFVQTTTNTYRKLTPLSTTNLFASYKLLFQYRHLQDAVVSLNIDNAFNRHYVVDGGSYAGNGVLDYALPLNVFADIKIGFE